MREYLTVCFPCLLCNREADVGLYKRFAMIKQINTLRKVEMSNYRKKVRFVIILRWQFLVVVVVVHCCGALTAVWPAVITNGS